MAERGTLAVEVTNRCLRSCSYCYHPGLAGGAEPVAELPAAELAGLVEGALAESGRGAVQLTGGEPLLRDDLWELVALLRRPGRRISLVTDGALLDPEAVERLRELGVGPVQPTLMAAERTLHNELKGADCFDSTVAAIGRLVKAQVPVSLSFVCTRRNHAQFARVVELAFALGVKTVAFSRLCVAGCARAGGGELLPTATMVRECLEVALAARERLAMRVPIAISLPLCLPTPDQLQRLPLGRCALGTDQPGFTIDSRGRLRACSVSPEVLGDLRRESWSAIVSRAAAGYFARMVELPAACRGCPQAERCGGGCRESVRGAWGDFARPDPLAPGWRGADGISQIGGCA